MGTRDVPDCVFHYPRRCASLRRGFCCYRVCPGPASFTFSMDLTKLADEIRTAAPNYFLNVPLLLERMRAAHQRQYSQTRRDDRQDFRPMRKMNGFALDAAKRRIRGTFSGWDSQAYLFSPRSVNAWARIFGL